MIRQRDISPYARPGAFHRPNDDGKGTEREVSILLATHARILKPRLVIETGTYHGDTTRLLYEALIDNAHDGFPSELRAYEVDPEAHAITTRHVTSAGTHEDVTLDIQQRPLQADRRDDRVDLAFVDTAFDARDVDVQSLAARMNPRGLLFVHDVELRHMQALVRVWRRSWNVVMYATPRGLAVLQRPK